MAERLYLQCSVDCEPLAEKSPACGGPVSWEVSAKAIRTFLELFESNGLLGALSFQPTPEAARAHADLFRDLKSRGFEIGMQPNVPGFRFPTYEHDLGCYDREMQRQIIGEAIEDFESALGFRPEIYTACCGSKSKETYALLMEYGFKVSRAPVSGRYWRDRPDRATIGMFPFPHWASEHHVIAGCEPLFVIPTTGDFTRIGRDRGTVDLRPEREPSEETRESYRCIVDLNIEVARLIEAPISDICIGTHNTERVHFDNLQFVLDHVREKAEEEGMELVPISCMGMRAAAEEMGGPGSHGGDAA